jgi:hypothetical protein
VDCVWIAGGLYGNPFALDALIGQYEQESGSKALIFNGDFHWFDADPADFEAINDAVLSFHATRGNVETEIAGPSRGAGCGCGYPDWVDDDTVERSNGIIDRLRQAAQSLPDAMGRLAALPMHLRVDVAGMRVAVVHGDAESLAGWGFSQEALATPAGYQRASRAFDLGRVDIFASSHTCLPVLQRFERGGVLINNGAAGMPNFNGELCGLASRIGRTPSLDAVYGIRVGDLCVEAIPLRYDTVAWQRRFLKHWPAGSDAHASYNGRIAGGPQYSREQALRLK